MGAKPSLGSARKTPTLGGRGASDPPHALPQTALSLPWPPCPQPWPGQARPSLSCPEATVPLCSALSPHSHPRGSATPPDSGPAPSPPPPCPQEVGAHARHPRPPHSLLRASDRACGGSACPSLRPGLRGRFSLARRPRPQPPARAAQASPSPGPAPTQSPAPTQVGGGESTWAAQPEAPGTWHPSQTSRVCVWGVSLEALSAGRMLLLTLAGLRPQEPGLPS